MVINKNEEMERYQEALERIASCEAIYVAGCSHKTLENEGRLRMMLAERVLNSYIPVRAIVKGLCAEQEEITRLELQGKAGE